MNKKNKKISYKMLNSFLVTLSVVVFLVSFMFEKPASSWVVFSGIVVNAVILLFRIMLQYVRRKSVKFEICAIFASAYLFCFGSVYQAYWIGLIAGIFSYFNHSNLFLKPVLNETFSKICSCTYHRYLNNDTEFVNVSDIKTGDFLQLFSGETVPCDGIVKAGSGTVNGMCVTGDSKILNINKGDRLFAGFSVLSGNLIIEVLNPVLESSLSKTIGCILESGKHKTPKEKKASNVGYIVSLFLLLGAIAFIVTGFLGTESIDFLKYSIPLCMYFVFNVTGSGILGEAYESVIVNLASKGIVVKNKDFVEKNLDLNNVGFSVKGVLSGKKPEISNVDCLFNITEEELVKVAACALYKTGSSMAKVITSRNNSDISLSDIRDFKPVGDYGGYVKICGDVEVVAGSVGDLNSYGVVVGLENSDDTIYVGVDGKFAGYIQFETPLNEDIFQCMNNLRFAGVKNIFVYSHCNSEVAKQIAKNGNLTEVFGGLTDEQIKHKINSLSGDKIMFRYGSNCSDYSDCCSEIGYGGYDVFDRYDAIILTEDLQPPVSFVNTLKDVKGLYAKNAVISLIVRIIALILFFMNTKFVWLSVVLSAVTMTIIRINNLKFRYKI